ncbi:G8 domain-containing protein [Sphaerothrix gracilis]|uniref:G8 domain-containing protein n=1 Tax=Sphaerothrix gracilis TaxID=3151835 RepID=UPI0031FE040A
MNHTSHSAPDSQTATLKGNEHAQFMSTMDSLDVTHEAVQSGSWFDPTTWKNGVIPGNDAQVLIPAGVDVTYDGVADTRLFSVYVKGGLNFATDVDTRMVVDTLATAHSSTFSIGTDGNPIQADRKTEIIIRGDGTPADQRSWDAGQFTKGIITHGKVEIFGAEKATFLTLAADAQAGDTSLLLQETPQGWQVGDKLVLGGTNYNANGSDANNTRFQDEELTITRIEGNRIFFTNDDTGSNALRFDHARPTGSNFNQNELNLYVANRSRNIEIAGELGEQTMATNGGDVHQRGHVMFMHNPDVKVHYAAFNDLGRSDKLQLANSSDNVRGRYSLHFHRTGAEDITSTPAEAVGVAVKGSPGWGIAHHQSHLNIENSTVFETVGSGIAAEAGDEIGLWRNNIVIKTMGDGVNISADGINAKGVPLSAPNFVDYRGNLAKDRVSEFDFGFAGEAYWLQGGLQVQMQDNIAVSSVNGVNLFSENWLLSNKDAHTIAIRNLAVRQADGTLTEPPIMQALLDAGYSPDDRVPVGILPPKQLSGLEVYNANIGLVSWFVQRNDNGQGSFDLTLTGQPGANISHDVQGQIQDLTVWGVTNQGLALQNSTQLDFKDVLLIGDPANPLAYESGGIGHAKGVGITSDYLSSQNTFENFRIAGFANGVSLPIDPTSPQNVPGNPSDTLEVAGGLLKNGQFSEVDNPLFPATVIRGGAGNDRIIIDVEDATATNVEVIYGGPGNDILGGGPGNDVLIGGPGDDVFGTEEESGVNVYIGGAGNDTFYVDGDNNWSSTFRGGEGFDQIINISYWVGFENFNARESSIEYFVSYLDASDLRLRDFVGSDNTNIYDFRGMAFSQIGTMRQVVDGQGGDDIIYGAENANGEEIRGDAGNDFLSGEGGDDFLLGGVGADVLRAGAGRDRLSGGSSDRATDIYEFDQRSETAIITAENFELNHDVIRIALPDVKSLADVKAIARSIQFEGRNAVELGFGNGKRMILEGFSNLNAFQASNFEFVEVLPEPVVLANQRVSDGGNSPVIPPDPVTPPVDNGGSDPDPVTPPVDNGSPDPVTPPVDNSNPDPITPPIDNEGGSDPDPVTPPVDNGNPDPVTPPVDNGGSDPDPVTPPVDNETNPDPVTPPIDNGNPDPVTPPVDNEGESEPDPVTPPVDDEIGSEGPNPPVPSTPAAPPADDDEVEEGESSDPVTPPGSGESDPITAPVGGSNPDPVPPAVDDEEAEVEDEDSRPSLSLPVTPPVNDDDEEDNEADEADEADEASEAELSAYSFSAGSNEAVLESGSSSGDDVDDLLGTEAVINQPNGRQTDTLIGSSLFEGSSFSQAGLLPRSRFFSRNWGNLYSSQIEDLAATDESDIPTGRETQISRFMNEWRQYSLGASSEPEVLDDDLLNTGEITGMNAASVLLTSTPSEV